MSRILVIGGFGFNGRRVVSALQARGHSVTASSRVLDGREGLELDLGEAENFTKLSEFELVVNASDSVTASPEALARQVLEFGGTWIEMSAHVPTIERLLELHVGPHPLGTLIIGAGLVPGMSSVLARAALARTAACEHVELGVRLSLLSGGGRGRWALLADALFQRASRIEGRELRRSATALGPRVQLDPGDPQSSAVQVTLADMVLIERASEAANVATYLSFVSTSGQSRAAIGAWLCRLLRPLRRLLLGPLTSWLGGRSAGEQGDASVELVAIVNRGRPDEAREALGFADAHEAAALGVTATVEAWLRRDLRRRPLGVFALAELFDLDELRRYFEPPATRSGTGRVRAHAQVSPRTG